MVYTHRFIRVTVSGKIEDRFLAVQVSKPEDTAKLAYGTIFNLIEITSRWFPTSQIAQSIINTLRREYYKGASTSDLENFENAVKKVNEQLATLTQNGQTEWVGNLNSQLVLLNGNDAHISSTGLSRAYLAREGKLIAITEPKSHDPDSPPLKTFSSITSGTLQDRDFLLFSSAGLHDHVSNEDLKDAFQELTPYKAALHIVRILKRLKIHNIGFTIVEILSDQSASNLPLGDPEVIYLDQPLEKPIDKARRIFGNYLVPFAAKTAVLGKKAAQKSSHIFKTHVVPTSSKIAKSIVEKSKPLARKALDQTKQSVGNIKVKVPTMGNQGQQEQVEADAESLIGKTIFNIHDYSTGAKPKRRLNLPLNNIAWHRLLFFVRNKRNRPLLYIAGTIVLILILVISVSVQKKNEKSASQSTQAKTVLEDAKRRLEEGKTALIFNNKQEAQVAFTDSIKLAKEVISAKKFESDGKTVLDEAESQLDKLVGSNRLKNLKPAVTFENADTIVVLSGKVLAVQKNSTNAAIGDVVDGQVQKLSAGLDGQIQTLHASKDSFFVSTDSGFYKIDAAGLSPNKLTLAEDAKVIKGADLSEFIGNLYLLSPADSQIWKYAIKDSSLQKQTAYIKGTAKMAGAISLAIDGSVYVLTSEGKLAKFSQGRQQEFTLTGLQKGLEAIEKPLNVFTSEESSSIFIADGGSLPRILEFDKQGKFLQQFLFQSDLEELKDIWFQPTGRKAWALFGNSVYELNL